MTETTLSGSGNRGAARWRLGLALCASAVGHAWLLAALHGPQRPRAAPVLVINATIEMRAIPQEMGSDSISEAHVFPLRRDVPRRQGMRHPGISGPTSLRGEPHRPALAPAGAPARAPESAAHTLPQPIDITWYGAHELDAYPRALSPLRFDIPGAAGLGNPAVRLLLWLRIDEHGRVVDVRAGEPGVPGEWVEAARARLAAIRFTPARKDERAVKSRIQIDIAY